MTVKPDIDVSILVVSYNTREMTLAALRSIVRETANSSYEIIVVDNASTDGSAEAIAEQFPQVQLLSLDTNIGFGRANNLAAERASGDYILLLNPDTVVLDGAIDKLLAFARANKRALIWGGRTEFADGSLNPASCWGRITLWNLLCRASGLTGLFPNSALFNTEAYGGWKRDSERDVDIVSGCFLLIPRPVWLALGGFDPAFFMYGEEADLCLRARRIGAHPRVTPTATIIHHGGASEKTSAGKMIRLLQAKATLIARHWPAPFTGLGQWLLVLWPLSRCMAHAIAYRVTGRSAHNEAATTWGEIWQARSVWRFGYPMPELTAMEKHARRPILPPVRGSA